MDRQGLCTARSCWNVESYYVHHRATANSFSGSTEETVAWYNTIPTATLEVRSVVAYARFHSVSGSSRRRTRSRRFRPDCRPNAHESGGTVPTDFDVLGLSTQQDKRKSHISSGPSGRHRVAHAPCHEGRNATASRHAPYNRASRPCAELPRAHADVILVVEFVATVWFTHASMSVLADASNEI
jgi:hypothetical protein